MKNDGNSFFKYAVAVAVACTADEKPTGKVTQEQAATYIRSILDLVFCYSGIEYDIYPMPYPRSGKIPIIIRLYAFGDCLLWYYPNMSAGDLAVELESLLHNMLAEVLCMSA